MFRVLVVGTAHGGGTVVENPKLKLAHLLFGMLFEISDRLVQAFGVDMFPRPLIGFIRFGCIPVRTDCSRRLASAS
jgi:hypothetical protein